MAKYTAIQIAGAKLLVSGLIGMLLIAPTIYALVSMWMGAVVFVLALVCIAAAVKTIADEERP